MNSGYFVSENIKYLCRIFDLTLEEMALKTTVPIDKLRLLEEIQDDSLLNKDRNLRAVCFICNYFALFAENFCSTDLGGDLYTASILVDLRKEIKNGIPFDRSSFYSYVIDGYRLKQHKIIKSTSLTDAVIRIQSLLVSEILDRK